MSPSLRATPSASLFTTRRLVVGSIALFASGLSIQAAELLTAGKPLAITGSHGRFDFLTIDTENRRLLAAHTGNASLDVIDLDKQQFVKCVQTGAAQSSASDPKTKHYYVAVSQPPQLVTIDATKLEVIGKVPLPGPADLMALNTKTGQAYVGHDDGKDLWVIDPTKGKIAETIALPAEAPEDLGFDSDCTRVFQCIKTSSTVAVVDVATHKVTANWPTAPAQSPHGMAVVAETRALLIAGGNGKLVMMSQKDGKVLGTADIAKSVDQIAYDVTTHRVYCASSTGKISVLEVKTDGVSALGEVTSAAGAKSIVVDQKTHTVWIAYAKGEASFVQPFTP